MTQISENALRWLAFGERGVSSNTMFTVITGINAMSGWNYYSHPLDPDDFRRCENLLRAVPEFREKLTLVSSISDIWRKLVENWGKIISLMEQESPGIFKGGYGQCKKAYEFMQSLGCT